MPADLVQPLLEVVYPPSDEPAVRLDLRLAWPSRADAAAQPFQVAPLAGQPRQQVLRLGQLHLQRPFPASRVASEDIQDQRRTIDDLDVFLERVFQAALLRGRELRVADECVEGHLVAQTLDLLELPLANVGHGWRVEVLLHGPDHLGTGGGG